MLISKNEEERFKYLTNNPDCLYIGYHFNLLSGQLDFEELDNQKALLKDDPSKRHKDVRIGNLALGLTPSRQFPYAWIVKNRDCTLTLARANNPNIYAVYSSEALWSKRAMVLYTSLLDNLKTIGSVPIHQKTVSRLDFAFDYYLPFRDFSINDFATRAKKDSQWRKDGKAESFTFGTGVNVIKIDNKSEEIVQQRN